MRLADKVAIVTGGGSGIGRAAALLFAREGASVLVADIEGDAAGRTAAAIEAAGGRASSFRLDVSKAAEAEALTAACVERYGRLDVLINNAGIGPISPLDDLRVDEWDAMVDVNVKGVLHGIAAALPVFRAQGSGHFVNTASTAAHTIRPAMAVYSATKMAVRAISEGLRQEAGPNLRVTVITPGMTDTGFADDISNPEVRAQIAASKTDFGMPPAAIAHAMAYAIAQPPEVDVGEVIVRPTAQS